MRTVLQFSGGKDSLACLYLLRQQWDSLIVVWANAGNPYPDMLEFMERWKQRIPNFVVVQGNQPENVKLHGWPADIVPTRNTTMGKIINGTEGPLLQHYTDCCRMNLWEPMTFAMQQIQPDVIVRGQRVEDDKKLPLRDGDVVDGITYRYPIQGWTTEGVFAYLRLVDADMPLGYDLGEKSGRDCWDCTAYLDENKQRIANLPEDRKNEIKRRLGLIRDAVAAVDLECV